MRVIPTCEKTESCLAIKENDRWGINVTKKVWIRKTNTLVKLGNWNIVKMKNEQRIL